MAKLSVKSLRIVAGMKARIGKAVDLWCSACGHDGPCAEAAHYEKRTIDWLKTKLAELETTGKNPK